LRPCHERRWRTGDFWGCSIFDRRNAVFQYRVDRVDRLTVVKEEMAGVEVTIACHSRRSIALAYGQWIGSRKQTSGEATGEIAVNGTTMCFASFTFLSVTTYDMNRLQRHRCSGLSFLLIQKQTLKHMRVK
jgi:hypothetical protein